MAVSTLPLLPADYPLFDWADWPTDRAALVELGETQNFRAACWAAIVETLTDALDTAGIAHEDDLELVDGLLYADKFNALIDTIGCAADLNWRWAYDPTYRGYIGREKMIGTGDAGSETYGDIVYPEYILDICARVTLIIELLRGTAETTSSGASVLVPVPFLTAPLAGKGVPIAEDVTSFTETALRPVAGKGLLATMEKKLYLTDAVAAAASNRGVIINAIRRRVTDYRCPATSRKGRQIVLTPLSTTPRLVEMISYRDCSTEVTRSSKDRTAVNLLGRPCSPTTAKKLCESGNAAAADQLLGHDMDLGKAKWLYSKVLIGADRRYGLQRPFAPTQYPNRSRCVAAAVAPNACTDIRLLTHLSPTATAVDVLARGALRAALSWKAETGSRQVGQTGFAFGGSGKHLAPSRSQAGGILGEKLAFSNTSTSDSNAACSGMAGEQAPAATAEVAVSLTKATARGNRGGFVSVNARGGCATCAALDSAWYPPVWVGDGLWIRQAYAVKQNDDDSLEVS